MKGDPNDLIIHGECHVQADAEWIVIRRALRGHNDTLFGQPAPSWPNGHPGVGHPQGVFGGFSYYQLVMLLLNMVCLIVASVRNIHLRWIWLKSTLTWRSNQVEA